MQLIATLVLIQCSVVFQIKYFKYVFKIHICILHFVFEIHLENVICICIIITLLSPGSGHKYLRSTMMSVRSASFIFSLTELLVIKSFHLTCRICRWAFTRLSQVPCINHIKQLTAPSRYTDIQGGPKKWTPNALHITLSNIGRF